MAGASAGAELEGKVLADVEGAPTALSGGGCCGAAEGDGEVAERSVCCAS